MKAKVSAAVVALSLAAGAFAVEPFWGGASRSPVEGTSRFPNGLIVFFDI